MSLSRKLIPWNALLLVSALAIAGLFLFDRLAPMPEFKMSGKAIADQENRLRAQTNALYAEAVESERLLATRLWTDQAELIGPKAMATTTRIASNRQVKLSAFRPLKSVREGTLVRYPFVISLEGTYPQVIGFIRDLESAQNKLVVNVVQIASSDGASSAVNAIVGIWALQEAREPEKKLKTGKPNV